MRAPTPTPFPSSFQLGTGGALSRLSCHIGFMGHIYSSSCNIYLSSHMELLSTEGDNSLVGGCGLFDVTQESVPRQTRNWQERVQSTSKPLNVISALSQRADTFFV